MDNELYHYGVPGMKWGVRRNRSSGAPRETKRKTHTDRTASTSTAANNKKSIKVRAGEKVANVYDKVKVNKIITNAALVASGTLRVAAALVPGASLLADAATVVGLASTAVSVNNAVNNLSDTLATPATPPEPLKKKG